MLLDLHGLDARGIHLSKSTLRRLERCGEFPARVYVSPRKIAWLSSDVDAWLARRAASRRAA
jgi:prophage regulatory protein